MQLQVLTDSLDAFDAPSNFPFPSPIAPAPGPSLLDDNESKFMESFFDGVSSDQGFNYDIFTNPPDGPEFGFGGWDELPPTFMGTTSSFGQQPQMGSHGMSDINFHDMNSHISSAPSIPPSTSADVLAAATLLQNGSNRRSHSMGNEPMFRGHDSPISPGNNQVRPPSISRYPSGRSDTVGRERSGDGFMGDPFYTDMVFGTQSRAPGRPRQISSSHAKADIRWGSDSGFGISQGFIPPINQRKEVANLERSHIKAVEGAFIETSQMPSSADTTRASSPAHIHSANQRTKSIGQINDDEQDSRPRKRRKSTLQDDRDDDEESPVSATFKQGNKRRKSTKMESPLSSSEQSHKRRKSAAAAANAAAKATRENLTEEQKRENHIKSEQKRRTLIREGFDDLNQLVPGLRGGGFSKSAVLIMAADFLEETIQGNDILRQRLDTMKRQLMS